MFFDTVLAHVVEMAVVQVIDVPIMLDGRVPAVGAVLVSVIGVKRVWCSHVLASCQNHLFIGRADEAMVAILGGRQRPELAGVCAAS